MSLSDDPPDKLDLDLDPIPSNARQAIPLIKAPYIPGATQRAELLACTTLETLRAVGEAFNGPGQPGKSFRMLPAATCRALRDLYTERKAFLLSGVACSLVDGALVPVTPPTPPITRAELIEVIAPVVVPEVVAPVVVRTTCGCNPPPLSVRGICPSCNLTRTTVAANRLPATLASVPTTPLVAPVEIAPSPQIKAAAFVAGAVAEGNGILSGWDGRGTLTRPEFVEALTAGGFPAEWAPIAKTAHAQAGRILGGLNSLGYVVRADRTKSQKRKAAGTSDQEFAEMIARDAKLEGNHQGADAIMTNMAGGVATWKARWLIGTTSAHATVGGAYGDVVMVATLDGEGHLWLDTKNTALSERVRADFEAAIRAEVYSAADVSDWLKHQLVSRFRACRIGGNYYIKRQHAEDAERLLTVFSRRWGQNWLIPALPVATSEQLRAGMAAGFSREIDDVIAEYRTALEKAKTEEREMGSRLATSLHEKLETLTERCTAFALLLGDSYVQGLREKCVEASELIQESMDAISVRFGLIFDELARDSAKADLAREPKA